MKNLLNAVGVHFARCVLPALMVAMAGGAQAAVGSKVDPWNVTQAFAASPRVEAVTESSQPWRLNKKQAHAPGDIPQGLSAGEWAAIKRQIDGMRHEVVATKDQPGEFQATNDLLGLNASFSRDGRTRVQVGGDEASSASLRLVGVGYEQLHEVGIRPEVEVEAGRLTYRWSQNVVEWWVNEPGRLEQWFRLEQRPSHRESASVGPLRVALSVDSALTPALNAHQELQLRDKQGKTRLQYDHLKVWDADGKQLHAQMRLAGRTLTLEVEDQSARYPLTIDPTWSQQAYLKSPSIQARQGYGSGVAMSGDTLVISGWMDSYVFTRSGSSWAQQAHLSVGGPVALSGDTLVIGSEYGDGAYVFTRSAGTWTQQASLAASNADPGDGFGRAVGIDGDVVVVGAPLEASASGANPSNNTANSAGAAYVFVRSGTTWSQKAYLKAAVPAEGDYFGTSVAVSGNTVAVGATGWTSSRIPAGSAYVFTLVGGTWTLQATVAASNANSGDAFGQSVALSGNTLVVGAPAEQGDGSGPANNDMCLSGAAYVFTRTGTAWTQDAYLKASDAKAEYAFGTSLALSGDTLVVGAPATVSDCRDWTLAGVPQLSGGSAYVFKRSLGVWHERANIRLNVTDDDDYFGGAVATAGDMVIVGARGESSGSASDPTDNSAQYAGAAYEFRLNATTFSGPSATGTGEVSAVLSGGGASCAFDGLPTLLAAIPGATPASPPSVTMPHGYLNFTTRNCALGATVRLKVTYPSALPAGTNYYKWGPTPSDSTPHWYVLPATISGNTVEFLVTDGGLGDDDLTRNGAIRDPGGPGVLTAASDTSSGNGAVPVPTLNEWCLLLLGALAMMLGLRRLHHVRT